MKRYLKFFVLLALSFTLCINCVKAKTSINDLFQAGNSVSVDKKINGTTFLAGKDIKVNEKVDGIIFAAGESLKINSEEEYLFGAGNTIVLTNDVNKDLFLAAKEIDLKEINIKRDAYLVASEIDVDANVDRNLFVGGSVVTIKGIFNGNVYVSADKIVLDDNVKINGTLKYNEDATVTGLKDGILVKTYKDIDTKKNIKNIIIDIISSYIRIVLFAITLILMFGKYFDKLQKKCKTLTMNETVTICGKGFFILIGVPIISLILILTGLFTSVGVVSALVYGIFVYLSTILSAYLLMDKLNKKYFKKDMNNYYLTISGLLIIYILKPIPIIGGLVTFISIMFGLGILGNEVIELRK